mmetsp:Transcript_634/g.2184  ORF Transcript_634/g.2184 Transcript_634/m.2184 type:complete len:105 (-) Transcript_634:1701-2015(-)
MLGTTASKAHRWALPRRTHLQLNENALPVWTNGAITSLVPLLNEEGALVPLLNDEGVDPMGKEEAKCDEKTRILPRHHRMPYYCAISQFPAPRTPSGLGMERRA